ncbi:MAG: ABC transporter ATP-binding protein [Verrucomicrobium sp.]|nr:ABC transporter ATP-binding protein [Verrucomicrobium sp.]
MSDFHTLLKVENLTIDFVSDGRETRAVDGVSFSIADGRTVAIVGESGSGKSVTALAMTRLLPTPPAVYRGGSILFEGRSVLHASPEELRRLRGKQIAYIFQEPSTSLNPVYPVGAQIAEAIRLHRPGLSRAQVRAEVVQALADVGIVDPAARARAYPHELSGGMQQRVMIAMALACQPQILIADEPTTALDVTIQAQILSLLKEIKAKRQMAVVLITHNFGIIKDFADEVLVMFRGKIVERGEARQVLENPQHPYTKALIACVPRLGQQRERLTTIDYAQLSA